MVCVPFIQYSYDLAILIPNSLSAENSQRVKDRIRRMISFLEVQVPQAILIIIKKELQSSLRVSVAISSLFETPKIPLLITIDSCRLPSLHHWLRVSW